MAPMRDVAAAALDWRACVAVVELWEFFELEEELGFEFELVVVLEV